MSQSVDVVIIGAGMAGASLAAELANHRSVLLLEAESQPGYHSTGRSAAFLSETYGGPLIQPLTTASRYFLQNPPADFASGSFLSPRGALHIADGDGEATLEAMIKGYDEIVQLEHWDRRALVQKLPAVRAGWNAAIWEPSCADIDVARLHSAYLARARLCGAHLLTNAAVIEARRESRGWVVSTRLGNYYGKVLVNAAGAWADEVAASAGQNKIGIQPYRRTLAQVRVDPPAPSDLPLVIDALGRFYFKSEAGGRLWLSPHDETACDAGDCAAEEYDVALAVERLESVMAWRAERVEHRWAGLRSFSPDRLPVYGFAPGGDDFFWFAGQGGFGIQTAPAAAKLASAALLGRSPEPLVAGINGRPYLPDRFTN